MNPVLYIITYTDVPDLCPGKMAAQVAHAASQADSLLRNNKLYRSWKKQADGFGTTIVLKATEERANVICRLCGKGIHFGKIYDPTYPIRIPNKLIPLVGTYKMADETDERKAKGKNTVIFKFLATVTWIFGDKDKMPKELLDLPLR